MYLDSFDLDLQYIANSDRLEQFTKNANIIYSEAKKLDYLNTWKEKRRIFNLETRNITAMYERLFGRLKTDDCKKIIVECVSEIAQEGIINYSGIYTIQIQFNHNEFIKKSNYEKKVESLELLYKGIEKVVRLKEWDIKPFLEIKRKIIELNYVNVWKFKKPVERPNKQYIAEVLCEHDVNKMMISLIIKDTKNNIIIQKSLIEEPHEFAYAYHLGDIVWSSNNDVCLINKNGDAIISIRI